MQIIVKLSILLCFIWISYTHTAADDILGNVITKISKVEAQHGAQGIRKLICHIADSPDIKSDIIKLMSTDDDYFLTKNILLRRLKSILMKLAITAYYEDNQSLVSSNSKDSKDANNLPSSNTKRAIDKFYYNLFDTIEDWNIDEKTIETLLELKRKHIEDYYTYGKYCTEVTRILKEKLRQDETELLHGNIKPFLKDYELI